MLASLAYLSEVEGSPALETAALVRAALGGDQLLQEQTADSPPFACALATVFAVDRGPAVVRRAPGAGLRGCSERGSVQGFAVLSLVHAMSLIAGVSQPTRKQQRGPGSRPP